MQIPYLPDPETQALLARLRAFCFPGGEANARLVRAVRTTQQGEFRSAPTAPWTSFTAEEVIEATSSSFRWDARFRGGKMGSWVVTDAYEQGRGRLVLKLGGVIPVRKEQGPNFDRGELQRYLGVVASCPPMLLNNGSLVWTAAGAGTLHVHDREDSTGASVDLDVGEDGRPLDARAERPRMMGKKTVLTPWSGVGSDFREWEGLRVANHLEATWYYGEAPFTYFRADVTSFAVVRDG